MRHPVISSIFAFTMIVMSLVPFTFVQASSCIEKSQLDIQADRDAKVTLLNTQLVQEVTQINAALKSDMTNLPITQGAERKRALKSRLDQIDRAKKNTNSKIRLVYATAQEQIAVIPSLCATTSPTLQRQHVIDAALSNAPAATLLSLDAPLNPESPWKARIALDSTRKNLYLDSKGRLLFSVIE